MDIVTPGQFAFNYTAADQDPSLLVAAKVYDITTGTPVFAALVAMAYAGFGSYTGRYTGTSGHTYLVVSAVYQDEDFSIPDPNRAPGAVCVQCNTASVTQFFYNYVNAEQQDTLHIAANLYDVSTGTPVLISKVPMTYVTLGAYVGAFTGSVSTNYQVVMVVYTDGTYSTPDPNFAPAADSCSPFVLGGLIVRNTIAKAILTGPSQAAVLKAV